MKKTILYAAIMLIACLCLKLDGGTIFKKGENHIFYYLSENGVSSTRICRAEPKNYRELNYGISFAAKKGECAEMTIENLQKTLSELGAREVFSERGEDFENIYYYSPKIPFRVIVGGKKVNLHVSLRNTSANKAKIAAPINYGGY